MTITAVMVDQREPPGIQALTFGDVPTVVTLLDTGDIHVVCEDGTLILVERKTGGDFLNSLKDDRIFRQCADMRHVTPWAYLVITGEFQRGPNGKVIVERETGWSYNAVQGALLTIQELGVFVVFAAGEQDFEGCILRLAARSHEPEKLLPPERPGVSLSLAEAFLCGLPGIGPERAAHLMDYCHTAKMALMALTLPDAIPGIPSNVQTNARRVLGMEEGEVMCATTPDPIEVTQ
jgi:ERCC4-type nuclease